MVQLIAMNENDFQIFLQFAIPAYAEEKTKAGYYPPAEALERAKKEYTDLLPQGRDTKDQYLMNVEDEVSGQKVGVLWYGLRDLGEKPLIFIYDITIYEEFRRRGYAQQTFAVLEENVRALGVTNIGLNVFGQNHAARMLYEKLGYTPMSINMVKQIEL